MKNVIRVAIPVLAFLGFANVSSAQLASEAAAPVPTVKPAAATLASPQKGALSSEAPVDVQKLMNTRANAPAPTAAANATATVSATEQATEPSKIKKHTKTK